MSSINKPVDKNTTPSEGPAKAGPSANPWIAGPLCRCPYCGKGKVFAGFLKFAESCAQCGKGFGNADAGDGPAVFVILIGGALVVPVALGIEFAFSPPAWVHLVIALPLAMIVCLSLLRPFKSTLFALQVANKASEIKTWDK